MAVHAESRRVAKRHPARAQGRNHYSVQSTHKMSIWPRAEFVKWRQRRAALQWADHVYCTNMPKRVWFFCLLKSGPVFSFMTIGRPPRIIQDLFAYEPTLDDFGIK